jgi:hypothetical protein
VERGWKRPFDETIPLPRGRELVTVDDAGTYITKLPMAEHRPRSGRRRWKPYPGRDILRTDDVCTHWRHEGIHLERRPGVYLTISLPAWINGRNGSRIR